MSQELLIKSTLDSTQTVEGFNKVESAADGAATATKDLDKSLEKQEVRIKTLDGAINILGGSVEVLAGALAATGIVSEENAEKFQAAAVGAIALADGSKRILDGYKSLTEAQKLANTATEAGTVAQNKLNLAVLKNPYVLAAAALAALVAGIYFYIEATDEAAVARERLSDLETKAVEKYASQVTTLKLLQSVINDTNASEIQRESAFKKLQKIIPELEQADLNRADAIGQINKAIATEIGLIQQRARVEAAQERLVEIEKERLALMQEANDPAIWQKAIIGLASLQNGFSYAANEALYFAGDFKELNDETEFLNNYLKQNLSPTLEGVGEDLDTAGDAAKKAAEAMQKLKAAMAVQLEAELSLMDDRQRELTEREIRYQEDLKTLKEAGFKDFTALDEEYRLDQKAINDKYDAQQKQDAKALTDKLLAELERRTTLLNTIDDALAVTEEEKRQLRIQRVIQYYNNLIEKAKENGVSIVELEEAKQAAITAATKEGLDERTALEKFFASDTAKAIAGTLQVATNLAAQLSENIDDSTKEGFEKSKKYKIAEARIASLQAAFNAYASVSAIPVVGTVLAPIAAAAALLAGQKTINDIKNSKFDDTSTPGNPTAGASVTSGGGRGSAPISNSFASGGFLGQPQGTLTPITTPAEPLRAYVVSSDVSNGLQADAQLARRRTLGPG